MKKRILPLLLCLALTAVLVSGCTQEEAPGGGNTGSGTVTYADYIGGDKIFSVQSGDIYEKFVQDEGWCASPLIYQSMSEVAEAVRLGRADAAMMTEDAVAALVESGVYGDLLFLEVPREVITMDTAPVFHDPALAEQFSAFLDVIKSDGTLDEMNARYLDGLPAYEDIPEIVLTGENGTLTAADTGSYPPMSYVGEGGELLGYDIELTRRFAAYLGMDVTISTMAYDAVLPSVVSGHTDMSACFYVITDERAASATFSEPVMSLGAVLAVKNPGGSTTQLSTGNKAATYEDYVGKRFSILTGSLFDEVADRYFSASEKLYFNNTVEEIEAVSLGRTDAALMDSVVAAQALFSGEYDGLTALPVPIAELDLEYGVFSADQGIIDQYNLFLEEITADGTLRAMQQRWLEADAFSAEMPDIPLTGENGTLTAAIMATYPPFTFLGEDGAYSGFDIEQLRRFAAWLGMDLELHEMDFSALITYTASGKADIAGSVYITDERREAVIFGEPDYVSQTVLVVKAQGANTRDYTWFTGKTVGAIIGGMFDTVVAEFGAIPVMYQEGTAPLEDVRLGRLDGYSGDLTALNVTAAEPGNENMEVIPVPESFFSGPMGAFSTYENQALVDEFNAYLATLEADGTLEEMRSRWFDGVPDLTAPMPDLTYSGEKGVLRVAVTGTSIPFDYVGANDELKGYSVELMNRFAAHAGYTLEYSSMDFGGLIPAVVGGRADIAISCVSISEERAQSVLFSDPVFYDQIGIITMKETGATTELTYKDFVGGTFAIKTGTIYDAISADLMQSSDTLYFEDYTSIYEAVKNGRVDAGMRGYTATVMSLYEEAYSDLSVIALPEELHSNPIGAISMDQAVIDEFNAFLAEIRANGTLDEMNVRWFDDFTPYDIPAMPDIPLSGENGTLTVAISSDYMPFSFLGDNGVNMGFDIELALRFAAYSGKNIEFVDMAFSGLLPYVVSEKADLAVSDITITEERKKSVLFTDSYFTDFSGIIYRSDYGAAAVETEAAGGGFFAWLTTAIERNLITEGRWKMIVNGLGVTMTISFLAQILGTVLGCLLCWVLTRKNRFVSGLGRVYSGLIHGLPMVVLLMISYYIIFGKTDISAVLIAVAAFALVEGAAVAMNLKGAIDTVDPVEIEAARSIGFSAFGAFLTVTLPQAVRRALPAYCNGFVELVKATAIVGYIAIQDMTRAGDIIRSRTYDAFFPLLFVALIYLVVTTLCVQVFKLIVRRINKGGAK